MFISGRAWATWRRTGKTLSGSGSRRVACVCLSLAAITSGAAAEFVFSNSMWAVRVSTETIGVVATPTGRGDITVASPQADLGPAADERIDGNRATWSLPDVGMSVTMELEGDALTTRFVSDGAGEFAWPGIPGEVARGWILPLHEGSYVPTEHAEWQRFLIERGATDTTEGLSMPFWGLDCGDYTLTYIATNELNNAYRFEERDGRLSMSFGHEFTRNWDHKEYGLTIRLGGPSPIEPARKYREWVIGRGEFVSMRRKIERTPEAAKLLGAAHIYLWGDKLLTRHDVRGWPEFVKALRASASPPLARLVSRLDEDAVAALADIEADAIVYKYLKDTLTDGISEALRGSGYYNAAAWRDVELPDEATQLLAADRATLNEPDIYRLNGLLLTAALPDLLLPPETWGDGVSTKMINRFVADGLDRLWLGLDSWQGGFRHPAAIERAQDAGYLIGPYDSFHSIHDPDEEDTWETAQFDRALYETGAIVRADGSYKRGFKQKGYNLSPIAARPHVERRVTWIVDSMRRPYNSWFVDCDAYGELFDDYSELHPATQLDDMRERLRRMAWIVDEHGAVVGSEGGSAYAASTIHFAHGMTTPVVGWGDPDFKDKESPYYLGGYWPSDGPAVFTKQVPLKPEYYLPYFDPTYRLPLFQTAFHDSVVTTHQWGYASLKFSDQIATTALAEALYSVPPMYHMNLDEYRKHRTRMLAHYSFLSPILRAFALEALTDFEWVTEDRLVQRTVFGDAGEVVANFGDQAYEHGGARIPARGVLARVGGEATTYVP